MRVPSNEYIHAEIGLTNDPVILQNMLQASKERKTRGSIVPVLLCVAAIGLIAGFAAWCVISAI